MFTNLEVLTCLQQTQDVLFHTMEENIHRYPKAGWK